MQLRDESRKLSECETRRLKLERQLEALSQRLNLVVEIKSDLIQSIQLNSDIAKASNASQQMLRQMDVSTARIAAYVGYLIEDMASSPITSRTAYIVSTIRSIKEAYDIKISERGLRQKYLPSPEATGILTRYLTTTRYSFQYPNLLVSVRNAIRDLVKS